MEANFGDPMEADASMGERSDLGAFELSCLYLSETRAEQSDALGSPLALGQKVPICVVGVEGTLRRTSAYVLAGGQPVVGVVAVADGISLAARDRHGAAVACGIKGIGYREAARFALLGETTQAVIGIGGDHAVVVRLVYALKSNKRYRFVPHSNLVFKKHFSHTSAYHELLLLKVSNVLLRKVKIRKGINDFFRILEF